MGKAVRTASGKWHTVAYYKDSAGKVHRPSFTADTKAEVLFLAKQFENKQKEKAQKPNAQMTVGQAVDAYIELSSPVLSPNTISMYKKTRKFAFTDLWDKEVATLTDEVMQQAINKECGRKIERLNTTISPKSVKNEWGLVSSSLKAICKRTFDIKLPKYQPKHKDLPAPEDVINMIRGQEIELACLLAMWLSFSLSEVLGLKCSSIRNGMIHIDQVSILVDGVEYERDTAKVPTRKRKLILPDYLINMIEQLPHYKEYKNGGEDAKLIPLTRRQIANRFERLAKKNGYDLTFHGLRHLNASIMLALNVPQKYAMERGGWSTPHTMREVYQHTFSKERQAVDKLIDDKFEEMLK